MELGWEGIYYLKRNKDKNHTDFLSKSMQIRRKWYDTFEC